MHDSFSQPAWSLLPSSPQSWGRWCWMRCSCWRFAHMSQWRLRAARSDQPLTWSAGSEDIWRWGFMVSRWKPCWSCLLHCPPKLCPWNTGWNIVSVKTWFLHICLATCTWIMKWNWRWGKNYFLDDILKFGKLGLLGAKVMRDTFANINIFVSRCASPSGGWRRVRCLHVELEGERLPDSAGATISGHEQSVH